jgi:hypothetical protein
MLIDLQRGLSIVSQCIFFLPQRMLALDQQLHRRLDPGTEEATSVQEQNDAQASQLTRLLVPLVCVAIACLVAASAILLFVVLVRTRNNANSPKIDSAGTVHHIPPIAETSSRPPYEDIPLNETLTTTHEPSAGTPSARANANAADSTRAAGFGGNIGMGLWEAIRLRTRSMAPKFAFPPSGEQNSAPPHEVHRPNLLTGIHRQPSVVAQPDPVFASSHIRHHLHHPHHPHPHDAVPLSIVSTMTNSFNNETDDDDMLDMDLDLYLGLAAAASSSSREWIEKGASNGTTTAALSSIEEGDSSSRQLVEEIHWQGSSDVAATVSAAPAEIAVTPKQESRSHRATLGKPSQQHFVDALYCLVAAGVPPQAILGASYDAADSEQARSHRRIEIEGTPAAPESRRAYARSGTKKATAASAEVVAAAVETCRVPRKHGGNRSASDRAAAEEEGRDDAEDSHAGSSADGRNDTLLEL